LRITRTKRIPVIQSEGRTRSAELRALHFFAADRPARQFSGNHILLESAVRSSQSAQALSFFLTGWED
jgi:hypothetical protein